MSNNVLYYKDLIIDILVDNDLTHHILDLDELPCPLEIFENGRVKEDIDKFLLIKRKRLIILKSIRKIYLLGLQNLWDKICD